MRVRGKVACTTPEAGGTWHGPGEEFDIPDEWFDPNIHEALEAPAAPKPAEEEP